MVYSKKTTNLRDNIQKVNTSTYLNENLEGCKISFTREVTKSRGENPSVTGECLESQDLNVQNVN